MLHPSLYLSVLNRAGGNVQCQLSKLFPANPGISAYHCTVPCQEISSMENSLNIIISEKKPTKQKITPKLCRQNAIFLKWYNPETSIMCHGKPFTWQDEDELFSLGCMDQGVEAQQEALQTLDCIHISSTRRSFLVMLPSFSVSQLGAS